ncbi:hypothetical protein FO519_008031 [Halicephalobus sp. NKZ332]|nr:hypothetical protein FO519_008031 [Halicephalobus sp. NKZ332]
MGYKLYYFDVRYFAETARILFHAAGQDFEDITWSMAEWEEWKKKSPTGKAPWLEVDGHVISESAAIYRFLGNRFGFSGKDEYERAIVDTVTDVIKDVRSQARPYLVVRGGFTTGDKAKLEKESFWPAMESGFPYIKKILDESKSGFVAPSGLTWGDLWIVENIIMYRDLFREFSTRYTWVDDYVNRVHSDPRIKDFVESRKHYRISYVNGPVREI